MFSLRTLATALAIAAAFGVPTSLASAGTLCVGPRAGCFHQLQPAIAAAADGDTIAIAPGAYAGPITVDKSVRLQGAGAGQTVINGGGPVVTIARAANPAGLNVSIDGVTITGGVNDSTPGDAVTFGGGVAIPVAQLEHPPFNGAGATVSISNTVVTGNTVTSHVFIPPGFCGPRACGFNSGGGIDNGGVLTLTNTKVTNNTAGSTSLLLSAASDAAAGGVSNHFASTLIVRNSVVSGNNATVNSPIANDASGGGIANAGGILEVDSSVVSDNSVSYTGSMDFEAQSGQAGGINLDDNCCLDNPVAPTIRNTVISGNSVTAVNTNPNSTPSGYGGGVVAIVPALLEHVTLTANSVQLTGAGFAGADGGGMEVDAPVTIRDSLVARNSVTAYGPKGAIAFGGGIALFGADLTAERTVVTANSVSASGGVAPLPFGGVSSAFGGGISNNIAPATLTLTDSVVTANRVSGSPGFLLGGGGVFNNFTFNRTRTVIAGNKPDDCFGC